MTLQVLLDLRTPFSDLVRYKHILFFQKRKLERHHKGLSSAKISCLVQGTTTEVPAFSQYFKLRTREGILRGININPMFLH